MAIRSTTSGFYPSPPNTRLASVGVYAGLAILGRIPKATQTRRVNSNNTGGQRNSTQSDTVVGVGPRL